MSKCWKSLLFLLSCLLVLPLFGTFFVSANTDLAVSAHSAVVIESKSASIAYAKNANERLPMASTTKIMTAIVAARLDPLDTLITVTAEAVGVEGSSIYLMEGEVFSLEELLYALLLESANDAAVAIAVGLTGNISAFCEEMNRMAEEMGLKDTHFENPHGLDSAAHYTTAYELALITRELYQNTTLAKMVATKQVKLHSQGHDHARVLTNHNRLLNLYPDCIGVKTGYTKKSGRCLVSAAEKNGVLLIAVTLNAPNDWQDHKAMLDCGFSIYRSVLLCQAEEIMLRLPVVGSGVESILVCNRSSVYATIPKDSIAIREVVELPRFLYAPVSTEATVGRVVYFADLDGDGKDEELGEAALIACQSAPRAKKRSLWQWIKELWLSLFS